MMDIHTALKNDSVLVVYFKGSLDFLKAPNIKEDIQNSIDSNNKCANIIFNFENLQYIDSAGIGMIISLITQLKKDNKTSARICCVKDSVLNIFKLTGLHQLFYIDQTEEDSINTFS